MTKTYKYKEKYGIKWRSTNDGKTWFANTASEAFDCGIWTGVTTAQLNDPKYLAKRSSSDLYWNKYM